MMGKDLDLIINRAIKKANQLAHEYLTLEQILWSLLHDDQVTSILKECGASVSQLESSLEQFFGEEANFSILNNEQIEVLAQSQFADHKIRDMALKEGIRYQPEISLALQRVLQRAAMHAQSSGKKQIMGINLLIAMFQESESHGIYLLQEQGIDRFKLIEYVAHDSDSPLTDEEQDVPKRETLLDFVLDLTDEASKGCSEPLVGREQELSSIIQVLCRCKKNNPLVVGEPGVGKTILASGLAQKIIAGNVPKLLKDAKVFSLDLISILAGAKFRGDFEERFKGIIKDLEKVAQTKGQVVLFVDEIHSVIGTGSSGTNGLDASNLLKPVLNSEMIRCFGTTTYDEYRRFIEKDSAFSRRFKRIDLHEPSIEDTFKIIQGVKSKYEKFHGVSYSNSIIRAAIVLSNRHITDRKLPDKALDVIDEAGARIQLFSENRKKVTIKDIEVVISEMARIPKVSVANNEKEQLKGLEKNLKLMIFGQDIAVKVVCDSIISARSGLRDTDKPIGCFLFAGPTGVGKTELAKQLGINLGIPFLRFDMSEYMEKHAVAKLIGAPPGYVGHESGGILTDAVKKSPHAVLLLDEIEKAHEDIFNILLQVMDHGILTDSHGRKTDFRNVVLIMTTNAGAKEFESGTIGFAGGFLGDRKVDRALKNIFSPEFRNRLDDIVHFSKLEEQQLLQIVDKFLNELQNMLDEKKIELIVDDKAKKWLAKNGFDVKMGARPLARIIDYQLKRPLSHEILFGKLEKGGKVLISVNENSLNFNFEGSF